MKIWVFLHYSGMKITALNLYIIYDSKQTYMSPFFKELAEQIFNILVSGNSYDHNSSKLWIGFCPGPQGGQPQLF